MSRFLLIRLEAPLMAFGGVMVDNFGVTNEHPGAAMLTGLLANAMGWHHRDTDKLQALQGRLLYAVREDKRGSLFRDYQTVDLGQPYMKGTGWTTRGVEEERRSDLSKKDMQTHLRFRDYIADAAYTVALGVSGQDSPSVEDLAAALRCPARPLFIGRKPCLPSYPLLIQKEGAPVFLEAESAYLAIMNDTEALRKELEALPENMKGPMRDYRIWHPVSELDPEGRSRPVYDLRDWRNQMHTGTRLIQTEYCNLPTRKKT